MASERSQIKTARPARPQPATAPAGMELLDLLPCYVSLLDRDHRILFLNRLGRRDFGEGAGRLCHEVFKQQTHPCRRCPARQALRQGRPQLGEETFQTADGRVLRVLVNAGPLPGGTAAAGAVIEVATDVTALQQSNRELTALGQSIALLSHSIKNILEGLQGGAWVVNEAIRDGDMQLAGKGWRIVERNISDISDAVQNILYSAKNRPLHYELTAPARLAADTVSLYADKAAAMGVELALAVQDELPEARLDAAAIRRMLNNLVWNALEACHRDKEKASHRVTVSVGRLDAGHFLFEVSDNGIGMDEQTVRNIFEEFYSTKGSGGTGLGLAVVEKIVNKHGGRVAVSSKPGEGSTFRIIFPLREGAADRDSARQPPRKGT